MSSALVSSQSAFPPRKEFLRPPQAAPHLFALLVFNGTDILRLSNFPPNVIASLKTLFEVQKVYRAFREDAEMGVSEFIMADKLWGGKNIRTERLITLIFSTILSHNFRYVTTVAYGRIAQDTKSLVFSKTMNHQLQQLGLSSSSRGNSPAAPTFPLPSAGLDGPGGRSEQRACFALSLTSKTLRVLCAPKSCTPAILASVRSAWPRGVVSEGRPEDDVYEFHLKGYSMFSSSTFDRDALVHIFALLRSLDTHAFQLITNINLTQGMAKSRSKDLWIFEAPADPPSPPSSGENSRQTSLQLIKDPERVLSTATATTAGMAGLGAGYNAYLAPAEGIASIQHHMRSATAPAPSPLGRDRQNSVDSAKEPYQQHARAATSPSPEKGATLGRGQSVLRKPPPPTYAQAGAVVAATEKPKRRNSKSSFTWSERRGRGKAADGSPELPNVPLADEQPQHQHQPPPLQSQQSYGSQAQTVKTGPLSESEYAYGYATPGGMGGGTTTHPNSDYMYRHYEPPHHQQPAIIYHTSHEDHRHDAASPTHSREDEGLLSADAFRGTAYSGTSEASRDVPVAWSGDGSPTSPLSEDGQRTPHAHGADSRTPRTGNAPLPHQPEMSNGQSVYSTATGRPKSEKAFMGVMPPPPPPSSYPPAAVPVPIPQNTHPDGNTYFAGNANVRPGVQSRGESVATILPPGGFPKTPSEPPTLERQRLASGGSTRSGGAAMGMGMGLGMHARSGSGRSTDAAGKGWVLVNVEPSRKDSMDAAVAAMERERIRAGSQPTVTNLRLNDPEAEAYATAPPLLPVALSESPVDLRNKREEAGFDDYGPSEENGGAPLTPISTGKKSLKKKRADEDSVGKKKFLGLFGSGNRKKSATAVPRVETPAADEDTDEATSPVSPTKMRDDTEGATEGVKSESSWRRKKEPKAPTRASKLTIG